MSVDRRAWLWSQVVEQADGEPVAVEHVCTVAVAVAGVDRAAVAVVLSATPREAIHCTDRLASELEELTLTLGEGPGVDATEYGPVLVADLMADDCSARWPAFTPAAVRAGTRAVFALPLRIGAIRLGVMGLYRTRPGSLDSVQLADALLLTDTVCALLLDAVPRYQPGIDGRQPEQACPQHPEVHQATGMITVQLGVSATVALSRLRAHAYAHDRRLRDVAADVVARRLRFADTDADPGTAHDGDVRGLGPGGADYDDR